jgi:hypothetical protein
MAQPFKNQLTSPTGHPFYKKQKTYIHPIVFKKEPLREKKAPTWPTLVKNTGEDLQKSLKCTSK